MRIIKKGDVRKGYEGHWKCQRCGCEWEMAGSDPAPASYSDQRDGSGFHMPCPTCKTEVYRDTPRQSAAAELHGR